MHSASERVADENDESSMEERDEERERGRTVGDIGAKVLADDDVPGRAVTLVELLLDLCGDVLLDVILFESGEGDVDGLLLHVLGHVDVLDGGLGAVAVVALCERGVGRGGCVDFVGHGDKDCVVDDGGRMRGEEGMYRACGGLTRRGLGVLMWWEEERHVWLDARCTPSSRPLRATGTQH